MDPFSNEFIIDWNVPDKIQNITIFLNELFLMIAFDVNQLKENRNLKKTKLLFDIFTNHIKHIVEINICDNLSRGIKI